MVTCVQTRLTSYYKDDMIAYLVNHAENSELEYEGLMFDICISLWEQINLQSSVRFTAFRYLTKIAGKHPELFSEIELLTEKRYLDTVSAGIKRSIKRLIREIPQQSNVEN